MKKILTSLALLAITASGAYAQRHVNMEAFMVSPIDGDVLNCTDSFRVAYGFINRGPDNLLAGDQFIAQDPESATSEQGWQFTVDTTYNVGDTMWAYDANSHLNMTNFLLDGQGAYVDAPFANGNYAYAVIFSNFVDETAVTDTTNSDDLAFAAVTVNCATTSVGDVSKLEKTALSVYPNPAYGSISFNYNFAKATNATVRVSDIAGRSLLVKDLGKTATGVQKLNLDISSLTSGTYIIELVTDDTRAISKFSVK